MQLALYVSTGKRIIKIVEVEENAICFYWNFEHMWPKWLTSAKFLIFAVVLLFISNLNKIEYLDKYSEILFSENVFVDEKWNHASSQS